MKKPLAFATFVFLAACGPVRQPIVPPTTETPEESENSSVLNTYKDADYGFAFNYSDEWTLGEPTYPGLTHQIVGLMLIESPYEGTNFGDASFNVSAEASSSLEACLAVDTGDALEGDFTSTEVNGTKLFMAKGAGAGAGNFYETNYFRTYVAGTCFQFAETLHTTNIGNFDPGTVSEVDADLVWQKFDSVMQSLTF